MNKLIYNFFDQYQSLNGNKILLKDHYDFSRKNVKKTLSSYKNLFLFGHGNKHAKIYIFLETFNDASFKSKCNDLLDKILESIKLNRDKVFILDFFELETLKKNSANFDKMDFNKLFFSSKPELIIAMGDLVAKSFVGKKEDNFDKYRNKIHKYQDIDLVVTYHPKNLLSSPEFKRPTWEDFKYIRDKYLDGKQ